MLPTIENVVKVDIRQLYFGQIIDNTLYFKAREDIEPVDLTDLISLVNDLLMPELIILDDFHSPRVNTWSVLQVSCLSLGDVPILYESTSDLPITGSSSTETISQDCIVVSFYTALDSRSGRGRNYVGGYSHSLVAGGLWTNEALGYMYSTYGHLLTASLSSDWIWGVLSYYESNTVRTEPLFSEIVNILPRAIPGSMATRRLGRGS